MSSTLNLGENVMSTATKNDVVLCSLFNPHTFLEEHTGCNILRVSEDFKQYILLNQKQVPFCGLDGVMSHVLTRDMLDQEIAEEFFGGMEGMRKYALTFPQLAEKINLHNDKKDIEMKHGNASIFYVLMNGVLLVIRIYWDLGARKLFMHGWPANEHTESIRNAGTLIFLNTTLRN